MVSLTTRKKKKTQEDLIYYDVRESPELSLGESKFTPRDCGCTTSRGSQMCCCQFKEFKTRVELETGEN